MTEVNEYIYLKDNIVIYFKHIISKGFYASIKYLLIFGQKTSHNNECIFYKLYFYIWFKFVFKVSRGHNKLPKITLKLKMINYYYLVTHLKNPLLVCIVGDIKNLKKFLKIVDISLNSVIIYKCQGGPDTKYIIIH